MKLNTKEQSALKIEFLYSRAGYVCGIPLVYTASVPPGCPLGVCAAMLNVGIVGEGRLGMAPFTGWPEPAPKGDTSVKIKILLMNTFLSEMW